MGKINCVASLETNYVFHMLAVSECGYHNDYGKEHRHFHCESDLAVLRKHESLLTVSGGKGSGALYGLLVITPCSFEGSAFRFYQALSDLLSKGDVKRNAAEFSSLYLALFKTDSPEEAMAALSGFFSECAPYRVAIAEICRVMAANVPVFLKTIWPDVEKELKAYCEELRKAIDSFAAVDALEEAIGGKLDQGFSASICAAMGNGPQGIDVSEAVDLFGCDRDCRSNALFILHEVTIYLLKKALAGTDAFLGFSKWILTETMAEFYLRLVLKEGSFFPADGPILSLFEKRWADEGPMPAKELFEKVDRIVYQGKKQTNH
jgi:hypothetical protein